jgi:hypothetical protein
MDAESRLAREELRRLKTHCRASCRHFGMPQAFLLR